MNDGHSVSVIITVLRGSEIALSTVRILAQDPYPKKEIIVAVDEPDPAFVKGVKALGAKTIESAKRRGKVSAANEAAKQASGDVLIFLDSDVLVEEGFITKAVPLLEGYDVVEFAKVGFGRGLIASLASIDYVLYNVMLEAGSRLTKRSVLMNGSAFMIRRDAFEAVGGFRRFYSEDLDLATRCFKLDLRYRLARSPKAFVKQPSSFNEWLEQRIRWGYGLAEWALTHVRDLFRRAAFVPLLLMTLLVALLPSLTAAGIMYTLSTPLGSPLISFVELYAYAKLASPIYVKEGVDVIRVIFMLIITPAVILPAYYAFHLHYNVKASPLSLIIYYYAYQPLLLAVYITAAVLLLLKRRVDLDWVV